MHAVASLQTVSWWSAPLALVALAVPLGGTAQSDVLSSGHGYVCYRAPQPIMVDGRMDDDAWRDAPWSQSFVDILGDGAPPPHLTTRFKMLWDDRYLYVAAHVEEPHVWATLTERDARIYQDDDFEIFLDPDGDTHLYYEIEINAFGTVWDLLLAKPYRDGGPAISAWDIRGLRSAVVVEGTLNDPSDADRGWSVEFAIPWSAITESAPGRRAPRHGEQWRINFSRVDWDMHVIDGKYRKQVDPVTGRPLPEHNWVWSPQGAVNMHMPEQWGSVQFSDRAVGSGTDRFVEDPDEPVRQALRAVYHAQRAFKQSSGGYAATTTTLDLTTIEPSMRESLELVATPVQYEASLPSRTGAGSWRIRQDGKVWRVP